MPLEMARAAAANLLLRQALRPALEQGARPERPRDHKLIVGRGVHSPAGEQVLAPALLEMLRCELEPPLEVRWDEANAGRMWLSGRSIQEWAHAPPRRPGLAKCQGSWSGTPGRWP